MTCTYSTKLTFQVDNNFIDKGRFSSANHLPWWRLVQPSQNDVDGTSLSWLFSAAWWETIFILTVCITISLILKVLLGRYKLKGYDLQEFLLRDCSCIYMTDEQVLCGICWRLYTGSGGVDTVGVAMTAICSHSDRRGVGLHNFQIVVMFLWLGDCLWIVAMHYDTCEGGNAMFPVTLLYTITAKRYTHGD